MIHKSVISRSGHEIICKTYGNNDPFPSPVFVHPNFNSEFLYAEIYILSSSADYLSEILIWYFMIQVLCHEKFTYNLSHKIPNQNVP